MKDVTFKPFTFADTTITFVAQSAAAKAVFAKSFGFGAVEASIVKSQSIRFQEHLIGLGLKVEVQ